MLGSHAVGVADATLNRASVAAGRAMRLNRSGQSDAMSMPPTTLAVLILAVFTIAAGYGIALPILPFLVGELVGPAATGEVSRHTGLLSGTYTLAMFLFAPVWGRLSDGYGRRPILVLGIIGLGASLLILAVFASLFALYAERFLSGLFAAAVTPVAAAVVGDYARAHAHTEEWRARRLSWISMAGIAGFLLGPALGSALVSLPAVPLSSGTDARGWFELPFLATAALAFALGLALFLFVPPGQWRPAGRNDKVRTTGDVRTVRRLLVLSFLVAGGVGAFEVGIALRGSQLLGMDPSQIAIMFIECSLVMFIVQAIVFSPLVKPRSTRWLIGPTLAIMAGALVLVPRATDFGAMLLVVGAVGASAGLLSPVLTYWISLGAGQTQGADLGRQTAAASLGQALGSAAGGLLFNTSVIAGAPFVLTAALLLLGILASLGLPRLLDGLTQRQRSAASAKRSPAVEVAR